MKAISSLLVATSTILLSSPSKLNSTSAVVGLRLSRNDNIATTGTDSQTSDVVDDAPSETVSDAKSVSNKTVETSWMTDPSKFLWRQISLHDGSVVVDKQFNDVELGSWLKFLLKSLNSEKVTNIEWEVDVEQVHEVVVDKTVIEDIDYVEVDYVDDVKFVQNPLYNSHDVHFTRKSGLNRYPYTVTFRHEDAKNDIVLRSKEFHQETKKLYDSIFREWVGLEQLPSSNNLQNWVNQNVSPLGKGFHNISKSKFAVASCLVYNQSGVHLLSKKNANSKVYFEFNGNHGEKIRIFEQTTVSGNLTLAPTRLLGEISAEHITDITWKKSEDYNTSKSYYASLCWKGKVISLEFKEASKEKWEKIFNYWKTIGEQA